MPVSRGRRPKKPRQQKTNPNTHPQAQPTADQRSFLKRILDHPIILIVGLIAATIGIPSGIVTLLPNVSIEPFGPFDPSASSPTLFNIVNSGPLPLLEIGPMVEVCELQYERGVRLHGCGRFAPKFWRKDYLAHGDSYTISLQDAFRTHQPSSFKTADIAIVVNFRVPFTWWDQYRQAGFFAKEEGDGKLYWFRK